jgi:hypothetical protein
VRDGAKDGQQDVNLPVDDDAGTAGESALKTMERARARQRKDDPPHMPCVLKIVHYKCNRADGSDCWLDVVTRCPEAPPSNRTGGACEVRRRACVHVRWQLEAWPSCGTMR